MQLKYSDYQELRCKNKDSSEIHSNVAEEEDKKEIADSYDAK